MLFLNNMSIYGSKKIAKKSCQEVMILLIVLFVMMLTSILVSHLFLSTQYHMQLTRGALFHMQQFEASEAALLRGQAQLAREVSAISDIKKHFHFPLSSEVYANYSITLEAVRLPQPFCILPMQKKGYYYEVTAHLQSKSFLNKNRMCLKSTLTLPTFEGCSKQLPKRRIGRSAWWQLP